MRSATGPRLPKRLSCLGSCLFLGCSPPEILIEAPWPEDQQALLVVLGADAPAPRLLEHLISRVPVSPPVELLVRTYPPPESGGPDLRSKVVRIGGPGELLPAPAGAWVSRLITAGESGLIALEEDRTPEDLDLRFAEAKPSPCDRVTFEILQLGMAGDLDSVTVLSPARALIAGTSPGGDEAFLARVDLDASAVVMLPRPDGFAEGISLGWPGGDTLFGVSKLSGAQYQLDLEGRLLVRGPTGLTEPRLAAAPDGSVWARDESGDLVRLVAGSTRTVVLPRPADNLAGLAIADESHAVGVTAEPASLVSFDGTSWTQELDVRDRIGKRPQVATDGSRFMVAGKLEAFLRDESGRWSAGPLGPPFAGLLPPIVGAVSALGRGFLVAGDLGTAVIFEDERWCALELPIVELISDLDSTADHLVVVGVTKTTSADRVPNVLVLRLDPS
ncbi:MAG: hypothetical protein HYV07_29720 [Deltaproteobacteria bacterium]|nr:hypothetical protein [Deltaproteobacteria bacterium]